MLDDIFGVRKGDTFCEGLVDSASPQTKYLMRSFHS